ncbi:hypothetical protein [Paludibacterium paludis]|uniref:Uncharacterized protein n=1 Tax=Paludibacterium paludis TaxID=1225769 RepID=A0A918UBP9_9NEIS|nr:hypothetical protein [Paludibacterium paludis]GGY24829.1 hypothetical protein GCM10011289_30580 [Paludibacterium paludis]
MSSPPIHRNGISQRTAVRAEQADFLALLIDELLDAARRHDTAPDELPEHRRFVEGARACGFVCRDVATYGKHLDPYLERPELLGQASFHEVRRFVQALAVSPQRLDRDGGSPIAAAIGNGALHCVARRLREERRWREC